LNPEGLAKPHGYSHGAVGRGRVLAIAGQIGWDADGRFVDGFAEQFDRALGALARVLAAAGGRPDDLVSLRIYVVDKREYLAATREVGAAYRKHLGRHFPAMALVEVKSLLEDRARVEIEGLATIADGEGS
jgi:enamine deaminase RidA (YjgF/YER057c/UK114 family)